MSSSQTYVVKSGDTLSAIAKKYSVTVDAIVKANKSIKNPNKINVGMKLIIPVPPAAKPSTASQAAPKPVSTTSANAVAKKPSMTATIGKRNMAGSALVKGAFDAVVFSFNPEEFTDTKGNQWDYTTASTNGYPIRHFVAGKTPVLTMTLYANDREEPNSVDRLVNKLNSHIPYSYSSPYFTGKPPEPMIFAFGQSFIKKVWLVDFKVSRLEFDPKLKTQVCEIEVQFEMDTE